MHKHKTPPALSLWMNCRRRFCIDSFSAELLFLTNKDINRSS